ncbi:TAXI family TRAP transporter solute-binding subunit [Gordonia sp. CPCC 205515]|uniref:TAXI family TRAP transporter solute-binding subunit n=1 Tax=Gordonia sp. CPCC 205515 TaxID=3140791 RepID=UPI003AF33A75
MSLDRRTFLAALGGALATPLLASCGVSSPATHVIASGERGGFQSEFANLLAAAMSSGPIRLTQRNTRGSIENMGLLTSGQVSFGLSLGDVAVARPAGLAAVGRVYENYVQFAVPGDSTVETFSDLRGQRVSLGARGSGTEFTGHRVLEAAGMTTDDILVTPVSLTDVLRSLADGTVAAAMWAGGVPTPSAIPRPGYGPPSGIRLLDLSAELAVLRKTFGPLYEPVSVPADMYGAHAETATIGVPSMLLTTPGTDGDAVSAVVDVMIDRAAELIPPGTVGVQFLDTQSLIQVYGLPLHPAAAEAYRRHHG